MSEKQSPEANPENSNDALEEALKAARKINEEKEREVAAETLAAEKAQEAAPKEIAAEAAGEAAEETAQDVALGEVREEATEEIMQEEASEAATEEEQQEETSETAAEEQKENPSEEETAGDAQERAFEEHTLSRTQLNRQQKRIILGCIAVILVVAVGTSLALFWPKGASVPEPPTEPATMTIENTQQVTASPAIAPADPNYEQGVTLFNQGNYAEAVIALTQAVRAAPENAKIYTFRGSAYYLMQQFPEAISDLTRAIELDVNNKYAYDYRAKAYEATGRSDLANEDRAVSAGLLG